MIERGRLSHNRSHPCSPCRAQSVVFRKSCEVTSTKEPSRDTQAFLEEPASISRKTLCVGRLLENFVLVNVEAVADIASAKARMRRLAAQIPGAYLVFNPNTHEI